MKSFALTSFTVFTLLLPLHARCQNLGPSNPVLMSAREELEKANNEVAEREKVLEMQQDTLSNVSGMIAATPEAVRQLAGHLQTEKEALEVEIAGAKGREDAITKAIAKTTESLKVRADSDEVTRQMQAVAALRQTQLDRLHEVVKAGAAQVAEVEAAEAALATARADLAVAKQKYSGASNDLLEALNRELINLTISRQERAAKLEFINVRLKQLASVVGIAHSVERASHELDRAERHRDAAVERLIDVQRPPRNQQ